MIKVYCLYSGDSKMWAAAEDIHEASEILLSNCDSDMIEEGYEVKLLSEEEMNREVEDQAEGVTTSWRLITEIPGLEFPCIIGESEYK